MSGVSSGLAGVSLTRVTVEDDPTEQPQPLRRAVLAQVMSHRERC
jgi:hypothetical protein